jgi:pimeloyl-ACP methyl ester carboxylesterase
MWCCCTWLVAGLAWCLRSPPPRQHVLLVSSEDSLWLRARLALWGQFHLHTIQLPYNAFEHADAVLIKLMAVLDIAGASDARAWLIGHAEGGVAAVQAARSHPDLVRGVITMDTPWPEHDGSVTAADLDGGCGLQVPALLHPTPTWRAIRRFMTKTD